MPLQFKTIVQRSLWVFLGVVLYVASIPPFLVGAYVLKEKWNINVSESGGWHHFNRCLSAEMETERQDISEGRWGVLAPLAPMLISLGVVPWQTLLPQTTNSTPHATRH